MNQLQSDYWITSPPVRYWLLPNEKMYKNKLSGIKNIQKHHSTLQSTKVLFKYFLKKK